MPLNLRGIFLKFPAPSSGETIYRMRIFVESQERYGLLYHRAKFGGAGNSRAAGAA